MASVFLTGIKYQTLAFHIISRCNAVISIAQTRYSCHSSIVSLASFRSSATDGRAFKKISLVSIIEGASMRARENSIRHLSMNKRGDEVRRAP